MAEELKLKLNIDIGTVKQDLTQINNALSQISQIVGVKLETSDVRKAKTELDEATLAEKNFITASGDISGKAKSNFEALGNTMLLINQSMQVLKQSFEFLQKPIQVSADFESYMIQFKVMLGSTEKAKERLAELTDFAQKTPFELPQVVEAAMKLQAVGKYSKQLMTDLGDLSSATGKPLDQVMTAFSKLASGQKGEAQQMFRDLLITTEDWVKATNKGVTANGELTASYQEMLNVLPQIIANKNFSGMMAEQALTAKGQFSNLSDAITQAGRKLGDDLMPIVKTVTQAIMSAVNSFADFPPALKTVTLALTALVGITILLNTSMGALPYVILAITTGLKFLFDSIVAGNPVVAILATAFLALIASIVATQIASIGLSSTVIPALITSLQALYATLMANPYTAIATAILTVVTALVTYIALSDTAVEKDIKRINLQQDDIAGKKKIIEQNQEANKQDSARIQKAEALYTATKDATIASDQRAKKEKELNATLLELGKTHTEILSSTLSLSEKMRLLSVARQSNIDKETEYQTQLKNTILLQGQVEKQKNWAEYNQSVDSTKYGNWAKFLDGPRQYFNELLNAAAFKGSIQDRIKALTELRDNQSAFIAKEIAENKAKLNELILKLMRIDLDEKGLLPQATTQSAGGGAIPVVTTGSPTAPGFAERIVKAEFGNIPLKKSFEETYKDLIDDASKSQARYDSITSKVFKTIFDLQDKKQFLTDIADSVKKSIETKTGKDYENGISLYYKVLNAIGTPDTYITEVAELLTKKYEAIVQASEQSQTYSPITESELVMQAVELQKKLDAGIEQKRNELQTIVGDDYTVEDFMVMTTEQVKNRRELATLIEKYNNRLLTNQEKDKTQKTAPDEITNEFITDEDLKSKADLKKWYTDLDAKLKAYINYTELKEQLDKAYAQKTEQITQKAESNKLKILLQGLQNVANIFGKQTAIYKALALAQTAIDTIVSANAAFLPPPYGAGPLMGGWLAASIYASGAARAAEILDITSSMRGYAKGGVIVGENGPEVITPAEDFQSMMSLISYRVAHSFYNLLAERMPQNNQQNATQNSTTTFKIKGWNLETLVNRLGVIKTERKWA